jgi:hypothetical protein
MYEFDLPVSAYEPSHQRYDSTSSTASTISVVTPSSSPLKSSSGQQRVAYKNELSFTAPPLDRSSSLASLESVASSLIKTPPMENITLASPSLPPRLVQASTETVKRIQRTIRTAHSDETSRGPAKRSSKLLVPPAAVTIVGSNSESTSASGIAASFLDRLWRRKGVTPTQATYRQPEYYEDDDVIAAVSSHHGVAY